MSAGCPFLILNLGLAGAGAGVGGAWLVLGVGKLGWATHQFPNQASKQNPLKTYGQNVSLKETPTGRPAQPSPAQPSPPGPSSPASHRPSQRSQPSPKSEMQSRKPPSPANPTPQKAKLGKAPDLNPFHFSNKRLNWHLDSQTQGYQDGRTNIELNLAPNKEPWVRGSSCSGLSVDGFGV